MKIDFTRLLLVLIGFFVAQTLIQYLLLSIGVSGISFIILYNLLLAFVATLIYYPSSYRKSAFKDPEFYRNVAIFFLIFLLLSFVRI